MQFDCSALTHEEQNNFMESIKNEFFDEGFYKVFMDRVSNQFVFVKADRVIRNVIEKKISY